MFLLYLCPHDRKNRNRLQIIIRFFLSAWLGKGFATKPRSRKKLRIFLCVFVAVKRTMMNLETGFRLWRKRFATDTSGSSVQKHRNLQWHKYSLQKIADDKLRNVLPPLAERICHRYFGKLSTEAQKPAMP